MTHPTKPDRQPAVSEEDKARAREWLEETRAFTDEDVVDTATFAARIRAEEREACAKVAAMHGDGLDAEELAAAIRSRGEGDANEKG